AKRLPGLNWWRLCMGKAAGFMEYSRETALRRPVTERVNDWFEIYQDFPEEKLRTQGARCMDCGVPFCHTGCPVNNLIPDWNDLVYRGRWKEAVRQLHSTNNFPEFTGRICPAPCEAACVLGINEPAVTIKQMEAEGVKFVTNAHVGHWVPVEDLQREFDAILLAGGAEAPRDLNVPGRELKGIHFAMEYLPQSNKRCHGDVLDPAADILATG